VLADGARVMLIMNVDVSDGLVNGAQGQITGFIKYQNRIKWVLVVFDSKNIGKDARKKSRLQLPLNVTPIEQIETRFSLFKKSKSPEISRKQFPLRLCYACTIHKIQGQTLDQIVVSFQGRFSGGQCYVALSRTKTLAGLFLLDFDAGKIKVCAEVKHHMSIMDKKRVAPVIKSNIHCRIFAGVLNVRSLIKHREDILHDPMFKRCNLAILSETWLNSLHTNLFPDDVYTFINMTNPSCDGPQRTAGGVTVVCKKPAHVIFIDGIATDHYQILSCEIEIELYKLNVIAVYRSPSQKSSSFHSALQHIIECCHSYNDKTCSGFSQRMQGAGFIQCVTECTHRSGSCIDHMYVDVKMTLPIVQVIPTYYSDHSWIIADFHN